MKKIVILLSIMFLGLILMNFFYFQGKSYEVIEVVEGDLIYIDLNQNKQPDKNELFHLKGVNSFPLRYNNKIQTYREKFNLQVKEVFELGYFSREFTRDLLLNKKVKFIEKPDDFNPEYRYRFGKISLDGVDFGKILLENGFGLAYQGASGIYYLDYENKEKIKENSKMASKYNIKVIDEANKKYYDLDDKNSYYIKNPVFMPFDKIDKKFLASNKVVKQKDIKLKEKEDIKIDGLSLYLINPNKFNKPNNKCITNSCKMLLANIKNSKRSIDFAIYGIDKQDDILNALKDAKSRGVKLRCVSDTNIKGEFSYFDTEKLKDLCEIKTDNKSHFMHNKFFIFDDKKVLTGSSNITSTGIGGYNSNSIVLIENEEVALVYKKEFEQLHNGYFQNKKIVNNSKKNIKINKDTTLDVYFSPNGNIYQNVFHPLIKNAKSTIYIDVFYLTNKNIAEDLINAHKRGVKIKIIIDATSALNPKSKLQVLRENGINVKVENWGGKAHEKTMSVDEEYLVLGSANFTTSGMTKNDENLIVIHNPVITKFYNNFFMSLYNSIDNKYLTKIPSPESLSSKNSCFDGIDNDFDGLIDKEDEGCKISK